MYLNVYFGERKQEWLPLARFAQVVSFRLFCPYRKESRWMTSVSWSGHSAKRCSSTLNCCRRRKRTSCSELRHWRLSSKPSQSESGVITCVLSTSLPATRNRFEPAASVRIMWSVAYENFRVCERVPFLLRGFHARDKRDINARTHSCTYTNIIFYDLRFIALCVQTPTHHRLIYTQYTHIYTRTHILSMLVKLTNNMRLTAANQRHTSLREWFKCAC